jgi:hypothetical protein
VAEPTDRPGLSGVNCRGRGSRTSRSPAGALHQTRRMLDVAPAGRREFDGTYGSRGAMTSWAVVGRIVAALHRTAATSARAELTSNQLLDGLRKVSGTGAVGFALEMQALGTTWANADLIARHQAPIFCLPPQPGLTQGSSKSSVGLSKTCQRSASDHLASLCSSPSSAPTRANRSRRPGLSAASSGGVRLEDSDGSFWPRPDRRTGASHWRHCVQRDLSAQQHTGAAIRAAAKQLPLSHPWLPIARSPRGSSETIIHADGDCVDRIFETVYGHDFVHDSVVLDQRKSPCCRSRSNHTRALPTSFVRKPPLRPGSDRAPGPGVGRAGVDGDPPEVGQSIVHLFVCPGGPALNIEEAAVNDLPTFPIWSCSASDSYCQDHRCY